MWRYSRWWSISTDAPARWGIASWLLGVALLPAALFLPNPCHGGTPASSVGEQRAEFSGKLIKRVEGRRSEAHVFAKPDRLRIEYKYAIRTELGLSTIEIIRLDKQESWFLVARLRRILSVPVRAQDVLPLQPRLPGEQSRQLLGDATVAGRPATLYEVETDYNGRRERYYEWLDRSSDIVLKLVSQDRDWSIEYAQINFSPQPDAYFEEPVGYERWVPPAAHERQG